jgi:hypothetical protein
MRLTYFNRLLTIGSLAALSLAVPVESAAARTTPASAGVCTDGTQCASVSQGPTLGVVNTSANDLAWTVPLQVDTSGAKTITVRGRVQPAGGILCVAIAIRTDGTTASLSGFVSFPANGLASSITLPLSSVPTGALVYVSCSISASQTAELIGAQYTQ